MNISCSQPLTISQYDYDVFAPSWQAGLSGSQSLRKSLRNYDVESVNIIKTCDKLSIALRENSISNCDPLEDEEAGKQCSLKNSNIPFRAFTNIWFGTLKIYQQQVNTLFRLSQDLLSRSSNYDIKHLEASKRKSSSKSHKLIKKSRLTLSESTAKTFYSNSNYSQLLDDLDKITLDSTQTPFTEVSQTYIRPITQLQIREITMREINATTYSLEDGLDEDSGFGEATHEEIAEFFNFVGGNSTFDVRKTPTKRKSTSEPDSVTKQKRYFQDSLTLQNENVLKSSPLKRSITPTKITLIENEYMENPTSNSPKLFADSQDLLQFNIKKEPKLEINHEPVTKKVTKKKHNLIIDEYTKIDNSTIIYEMNNFKLSTKMARKRILKAHKVKRSLTALELLTRFNRRSLKLSLRLKEKVRLSKEQFESEYLTLLREIFNINFKENWASEIYPKWTCFNEARRHAKRGNKTIKENNCNQQPQVADLNILNEYINTDIMDNNSNNNNNDVYNGNQEMPIENNSNNKIQCIHHDWHPYGIMTTLLNLWRFNQTNEIAARNLFKLAEERIDRAVGFYSLLNLSKKHFVILTTFPKTIALQNIVMGKTIKRVA